jgi:hypothetical protein
MVSVATVEQALAAMAAEGGNLTEPTAILDERGAVVAVAQRVNGETIVTVPPAGASAQNFVQRVTGFLDKVTGALTQVAATLERTSNAVTGGAAGAKAGYNAPVDWTPYLAAGLGVVALLVLTGRRR